MVEVADELKGVALELGIDPGGIGNIEDGVALVAESHAGVHGREKTAGPQRLAAADATAGAQDDKGG